MREREHARARGGERDVEKRETTRESAKLAQLTLFGRERGGGQKWDIELLYV